MNFFNALLKFMLRSPLHPLVRGRFMLITVTGRKSGQQYTTPVNYVRDGDLITVISRRHRRWWRNLRGGAPVTVRIKGRDLEGTGDVEAADEEAIAAALKDFYERIGPERASPERVAEPAQDRVIIRIRLAK